MTAVNKLAASFWRSAARPIGASYEPLRGRLGRLDQTLQARFGTRCGIGVNHAVGPGPIELDLRPRVRRFRGFDIARLNRRTDFANLQSHRRLDRAVGTPANLRLTEAFLGAA